MSHSRKLLVAWSAFAMVVLCTLWSAAQGSAPGSIQGRVVLPSGASISNAVMIRLETGRGVKASSFTDNEGQFRFDLVPPGLYEVVVEPDKNKFEMASMRVEVFSNAPSLLTITLKEIGATRKPVEGHTVSATELSHSVPAAAKKEFDRAVALGREGKNEEAIVHFRKAIERFPKFLMAYNDLATQLMSLGRLDDAEEALKTAIEIDPNAFNPRLNLGIVLVQKHEFSEALTHLKKAVSIEPDSPAVRLYSGLALVGSEDFEGAERELKTAHNIGGVPFAIALFHLGELYVSQGKREDARRTFQSYLSEAPKADNADEVRKMIALLK